jgi:hypothetical protein
LREFTSPLFKFRRGGQGATFGIGSNRRVTYPVLPVIVVTGYVKREELKDFGEARMLQKPYTEGERLW